MKAMIVRLPREFRFEGDRVRVRQEEPHLRLMRCRQRDGGHDERTQLAAAALAMPPPAPCASIRTAIIVSSIPAVTDVDIRMRRSSKVLFL